jgi:seryl-tRNA synthetase
MLDMRLLRQDKTHLLQALHARGATTTELDQLFVADAQRRATMQQCETLKHTRNTVSQRVAVSKKANEDATVWIEKMREVGDEIQRLDEHIRQLDATCEALLLHLPNIPHASVPFGKSAHDNVEIRRHYEPHTFSFEPQPHWEIAQRLCLVDAEAGSRVTGSRFVFYRGWGARLERALANFMLDMHTLEHGYEPLTPPMIVHRHSMVGTGQLPKFAEDAFQIADNDYFLVPTAEVPVTNFYRDQMLLATDLPKMFTAYSGCFRQEAGAAGRDTRGLIRLHQFHKVELVAFALPEQSYDVLERMTNHAENVLKRLGLPYRVLALCTGDMGFTATKTYDIEVWFPSANGYREISSVSNTEAFQARRANIRFRRSPKEKPEFVHTLNGSGLAVDRTMAALIENYQEEDGSIMVPEALRPYLGGVQKISI